MTSKAQRRKRKISLPKSAPADAKRGAGRPMAEDARKTALQARLRVSGTPETPEALRAAESPLMGCAVGQRLLASELHRWQVADLWQAVEHILVTYANYNAAKCAPSRYPKCANLPVKPEETTADYTDVDLRDEVEKYRSAMDRKAELDFWLSHTDARARYCVIASVVDTKPVKDAAAVMRALECVNEGIKGQRITVRIAGVKK